MLDPDKPFITKGLLKQRRRHRRELLRVHDWIVRDVFTGEAFSDVRNGHHRHDLRTPVDAAEHHRVAAETLLRALIDGQLENEAVRGLLDRMEAASAGECLDHTLDRRTLVGLELVMDLFDVAKAESSKAVRNIGNKVEGAKELKVVVFHLLFADLLAGDYVDPRVEDIAEQGAAGQSA